MGEQYLYAWSVVTKYFTGYEFEHAFVTNYELSDRYKTFGELPRGSDFWYCWGDYYDAGNGGIHHRPDGAIGRASADPAVANALVASNELPPELHHGRPGDRQNGSIRYYAIDGVCHQVANQALFATGSASQEPLRVEQIGSYPFSTFFFNNYGLNDAGWKALREAHTPHVVVPADDFDARFAKVLPHVSGSKKIAVDAVRATAQASLRGLAEIVTTRDWKWDLAKGIFLVAFEGLKLILGEKDFGVLFPTFAAKPPATPDDAAHWLDPKRVGPSDTDR